jgi:hypothetical protein
MPALNALHLSRSSALEGEYDASLTRFQQALHFLQQYSPPSPLASILCRLALRSLDWISVKMR